MKDVSLHIFDLVENSAKAGASHVQMTLVMDASVFELTLEDNGPGFPAAILPSAADPFTTTRTERPVGLGLSLMRETARQTGGELTADNREGGGAQVRITIIPGHIDARPLGDLGACLTTALAAWPNLDITVLCGPRSDLEEIFSSAALREELDENELSHPSIRRFIEHSLITGLQPLTDWYRCQQAKALTTTTNEV